MKLVLLEARSGDPVYINPDYVTGVHISQKLRCVFLNILGSTNDFNMSGDIQDITSKLTGTVRIKHEDK